MLNIGLKIILHKCLTVVGVCVVVGDANFCTADLQIQKVVSVQSDWEPWPGDFRPEKGLKSVTYPDIIMVFWVIIEQYTVYSSIFLVALRLRCIITWIHGN